MRPHLRTLPRAARLRVPVASPIRQSVCSVRNYVRTAETLQKSALQSNVGRPELRITASGGVVGQTRWITQQHIRRTKEAEKEWAEFAEEIKAGKRKNFAQHLEDRGLLHDVVG